MTDILEPGAPSASAGRGAQPMHPDQDSTNGDEHEPRPVDPAEFLAAYGDDVELAIGELTASVQHELRRIAHRVRRKGHASPSFGTTDLVNEVYLRLVGGAPHVVDIEHFLAMAARTMRWIVVSRERAHHTNDTLPSSLAGSRILSAGQDLIDLDGALSRLRQHSEDLARIVEFKFFLAKFVK